MEKVVIPKKVTEAIENLRGRGISNKKLLNYPSLVSHDNDKDYATICDYIYPSKNLHEGNLENYCQALIAGYISDKSPDEKLRDLYEEHRRRNLHVGASMIEKVLEVLEIRIKGINN